MIAVAKPSDSSVRLSASPDGAHLDALRQALHDRQVVDLLGGVAERGRADEVGRHRGLPFAVVAVDAGRALVELDVGDHRQRHAAAFRRAGRAARAIARAAAGRRARCPRAGRGSAPAGRRHRTSPAPGRHRRWWRRGWSATGFRWRRRAAPPDPPAARMRSSGRSSAVSEITLAMIGIRFICVASSLATLLTMLLSIAGDDQRDRAQAVFVEEPVADVGDVFEFAGRSRVRAGAG